MHDSDLPQEHVFGIRTIQYILTDHSFIPQTEPIMIQANSVRDVRCAAE